MRVRLYGVLSHEIATLIEVFPSRAEADDLVAAWDSDEPELAGQLEVIPVELTVDEN